MFKSIRRAFKGLKPRPLPASPPPLPAVPLPPVPQHLQQALKDYPSHLMRLQVALTAVTRSRSKAFSQFDMAVLTLEGHLGALLSEANRELDIARATAGPVQVTKAEAKVDLLQRVRLKDAWLHDAAMAHYFKASDAAPT